jgi:hypothetical protein
MIDNRCPMCGQDEPPRDPNRPDQVNEIVVQMREIARGIEFTNRLRAHQLQQLADRLQSQFVRQHRS